MLVKKEMLAREDVSILILLRVKRVFLKKKNTNKWVIVFVLNEMFAKEN